MRPQMPCQVEVVTALSLAMRRAPDGTVMPEFDVTPLSAEMKRQLPSNLVAAQRHAGYAIRKVRQLQQHTRTLSFSQSA